MKTDKVMKNTILWGKTVTVASQMVSVMLIIEDQSGDVISLSLYNQINRYTTKLEDLQRLFPVGQWIGVKQPYQKILFAGNLQLRNDNPQNIILRNLLLQDGGLRDVSAIIERGNCFFAQEEFLPAADCLKAALALIKDKEKEALIL